MREEGKSGDIQETLLLPKSIGDSQPRDRRLLAGSLQSATTGKKRRAELKDKTCGGERSMKTVAGMGKWPSFHKKRSKKGADSIKLQHLLSVLLQVVFLCSLGGVCMHYETKH